MTSDKPKSTKTSKLSRSSSKEKQSPEKNSRSTNKTTAKKNVASNTKKKPSTATKPAAKRKRADTSDPVSSASKPTPKRPRKNASKSQETSTELKFKSPAEFFAENKNIAGFDNPGKSLYTTIRELVENGLDAAEAVDALPNIHVRVERINKEEFRKMVGIDGSKKRVDATLYKDVENEKEKKAREAKERREAKRQKKNLGSVEAPIVSTPTEEDPAPTIPDANPSQSQPIPLSQELSQTRAPTEQKKARSGGNEVFRVTVTDNGSGMAHVDVPNMMGRVLAGTKYCVRQARGKFGLGSKMALIWAKMSTGLPVRVKTAKSNSDVTECILDIDIAKNIPTVLKHERTENDEDWRGTEVSVTIQGNWSTYRSKVLSYMRQMAVITPYAQFKLTFSAGDQHSDAKDFEILFSRRTDKMPHPAQEVKHHPSSVNQLILKQLIGEVKPSTTLVRFLSSQFACIPRPLAVRLIAELGSEFTESMSVEELNINHIRQIDGLLHEARFAKPDGKCLSPAGEYNLRLGITKELRPSLVATHAEPAEIFEGHPFIVEAGVALGGAGMKPGINVYRFANRIPLLFEAGNDVVTKTAREVINWRNYKISPTTDRIGVICSIVSTKVPFKGTGKEYIGDDSESIKVSVKRAITQCCSQLKTKLVRRAAQKDAAERKKLITRYAPDVVNAIIGLFKELDDPDPETEDVAKMIKDGTVTKNTLLTKLQDHVKQVDMEQAIEYASVTGRDQKKLETVFIAPRSQQDRYTSIWPLRNKEKDASGIEIGEDIRMCFLSSLECPF